MSARLQISKAQQMPLLLCRQGVAVRQTPGGDAPGPVRPDLRLCRCIIPLTDSTDAPGRQLLHRRQIPDPEPTQIHKNLPFFL